MEEVNVGESWNKKKIFIAIFLLVIFMAGGYFLKFHVLDKSLDQSSKSVQGISAEENNSGPDVKLSVQEAVKEKIDSLKQEVSDLDIIEIASSSPQVQKILNDIKSLEQYPTNQIKEICRKICGL